MASSIGGPGGVNPHQNIKHTGAKSPSQQPDVALDGHYQSRIDGYQSSAAAHVIEWQPLPTNDPARPAQVRFPKDGGMEIRFPEPDFAARDLHFPGPKLPFTGPAEVGGAFIAGMSGVSGVQEQNLAGIGEAPFAKLNGLASVSATRSFERLYSEHPLRP